MAEAAAWSAYWAEADGGACLPGMPPALAERLADLWRAFAGILPASGEVLDVASGAGAVLRLLGEARADLKLRGVDYAEVGPAARALGVRGQVDAGALPFGDGDFAAVTAQFGLEYCPRAAWYEAARVLAPGGALLAVCHHAESAALAHNRARLAAMQALADAGMFGLARDLAAGGAEDALRSAAVQAARAAHGRQSVAHELPTAIGQMLGRRDAVALVAQLEVRARAEMGRLAAMAGAALNADDLRARFDWLAAAGLRVEAEVMPGVQGEPFAWVVRGMRA